MHAVFFINRLSSTLYIIDTNYNDINNKIGLLRKKRSVKPRRENKKACD